MRKRPPPPRDGAAKVWVLMPGVRRGYEAEIFLGLRAGLAEATNVAITWSHEATDLLARWREADAEGVGVVIGTWPHPLLRRFEGLPCALADMPHHYTSTGGAKPLPPDWRAYAPDDVEIGRLIARHFAERRLTAFGCLNPYTSQTDRWAALRIAGFCTEASSAYVAKTNATSREPEALRAWLERLPKPAGVFCVTDAECAQAAEACRQAGLAVPGQVALAGVNNDPVWVESTSPALTSVVLPAYDIGRALARATLARLLTGAWPAADQPLISPKALLARASSDTLAVKDHRVLTAAALIRAKSGIELGVEDLCRAAAVNRRTLEMLFRKHLGRSPYAAIQDARLEKARDLVANGTLPITEIAARCTLPPDRFGALFRKRHGISPLSLRQARKFQA